MENCETLIIGGGLIGLSIGRELHRRGAKNIVLVERGEDVGKEASFAGAGMLAPNAEFAADNSFYRLCTEALELYPDLADELLAETGIDIELERSGTLAIAFDSPQLAALDRRSTNLGELGVKVERMNALDILKFEPHVSESVKGGYFYPNDWQVENRKLIEALTKYAVLNSIEIRRNTEVQKLFEIGGRVTGAMCGEKEIFAENTIVATGAWTSLIKIEDRPIPFDVKPIRGQMISYQPHTRMFRKVLYGANGYIVPRLDGRVLVGATVEDVGFDSSVTAEGIESLAKIANEISPELTKWPIVETWAGLRPYAAGGHPIIGRHPSLGGVHIATAHYRNGILLAPLTAKNIADSVLGDQKNSKAAF